MPRGFYPIKNPTKEQWAFILRSELDDMQPNQTASLGVKTTEDLDTIEGLLRQMGLDVKKNKSGSITAHYKEEAGWRTFRVWVEPS